MSLFLQNEFVSAELQIEQWDFCYIAFATLKQRDLRNNMGYKGGL